MSILTLPATKNAHLCEYFPDRNYSGTDNEGLFAGRFMKPGDRYRSLLFFNTEKLTGQPSSKSIKTAYLQFYIYRNEIPSGTVKAELYLLPDPGNIEFITWNNQPPVRHTPEQTFIIPAGWEGLVMVELTSTVTKWMEGSWLNHGLLIKGDEENNSLIGFRSINYSDPDTHPKLIIMFED